MMSEKENHGYILVDDCPSPIYYAPYAEEKKY